MNQVPPKWITNFLNWFCPDQLLEEIEGDLFQKFRNDVDQFGINRARRRFFWNTIRYLRPGIVLRNRSSKKIIKSYMLQNYVKVGIRNLLGNLTFSMINIIGLSIGITFTILVGLWVENELSYDRFYPDSDRIFEAWNRATIDGDIQCWSTTPKILAQTLKEEFPDIEYAASYAAWKMEFLFSKSDLKFTANSGPVTEGDFFKIFSFPFLAGDPNTALANPNSIVLTQSFSRKLFGDKMPLGEILEIKYEGMDLNFMVTGIIKDLPNNTSFDFDYLISWELFKSMGEDDTYWGNNSVSTFVKLKPTSSLEEINPKIRDIEIRQTNGEHKNEIFLYPVSELHLYSTFVNGIPEGGKIKVVRLFQIVACIILVISCFNFINLSTARGGSRSKEVCIRKAIGARKSNLIVQFLLESVLIALIAGAISLVAIQISLPYFNDLTGKFLVINYQAFQYWLIIISLIIIVGLLAGIYPALYLSSFSPIGLLARNLHSVSKATTRRVLVVLQFGSAIILVIATQVVQQQIKFAQQREAGYSKDRLIYFPLNGDLSSHYKSYRDEILNSGVAISLSRTYSPLTDMWSSTDGLEWQGMTHGSRINFDRYVVDEGIVKTAGLEILSGRDLELQSFPSDSSGALINQTAAKVMGFGNPVGELITDGEKTFRIVGVFKDIITRSPYKPTAPMIIEGAAQNWFYTVHVKLSNELALGDAIGAAENVFKKYCPDYPFEYHFIDIEYENKFNEEKRTGKFATIFVFLSIGISCLGILGLSMFTVQRRMKEIGIRKIFGASVINVIAVLTKEPLKLIIFSIVGASPIAYLLMEIWLQNYEYHTPLGWQIFVMTGIGVLTLAWITISIPTIRSAISNPVESLRHE